MWLTAEPPQTLVRIYAPHLGQPFRPVGSIGKDTEGLVNRPKLNIGAIVDPQAPIKQPPDDLGLGCARVGSPAGYPPVLLLGDIDLGPLHVATVYIAAFWGIDPGMWCGSIRCMWKARRKKRTAGQVLSEFARQALAGHGPRSDNFYGFAPLPHRGAVVTNDLIDRIRDEED